jgi:DNA-binding XRE family transcriptional regulator
VSTTRYVPALRVLRNQQGLAQADLATTCGVSQATISALQTGRKCLSRDLAVRLAVALRCDPHDLLDTSYELVRRVS